MQVNSVASPMAASTIGQVGLLFLPDLLNITTISPQTQALREQRDANREDADDRRDADDAAQQLAAADNPDVRPPPADPRVAAQREAAESSRATRRQVSAQDQQKSTFKRDSFQQSLAEAAARQNTATTAQNAAAAQQTEVDGESAESTTPQSTTANKPVSGTGLPAKQPDAAPTIISADSAPPTVSRNTAAVADPRQFTAVPAQTAPVENTTAPIPVPPQAPQTLAPLTAANPTTTTAASPATQTSAPAVQSVNAVENSPATQTNTGRTALTPRPATAPNAGESGKTDANFERILRVLRAQITQNRSQTTLQLNPPELGKIRVHMDLRNDALRLRFESQTALAYRLLSGEVDSLRDGLQATGVHLEHVDIRPPEANAAPENLNLPSYSGGGNAGGGAEADTDRPRHSGTDSPTAGPSETAAREANSEPSAEPRVNVWA